VLNYNSPRPIYRNKIVYKYKGWSIITPLAPYIVNNKNKHKHIQTPQKQKQNKKHIQQQQNKNKTKIKTKNMSIIIKGVQL